MPFCADSFGNAGTERGAPAGWSDARLTTRLNDAHVNANSTVILDRLGGRYPAFEAGSIGGQVVVWKLPRDVAPGDYPLQAGDVITHVDGRHVAALKRERSRFVAAGNPAVYERKLLTAVLRGNGDSATYVIERGGQTLTRTVAVPPRPTGAVPRSTYPVGELAYVLPNTTIGYIHMGDLNPVQVDSALAIVRNTTGLVMDVRNYPRGTLYQFARFFNPEARPFVKFAMVDSTSPGQVVWLPPVMAGDARGNASSYRGRVAILVDERTQSHAEFSVMALRTAPENKVIGSQTAGADGMATSLLSCSRVGSGRFSRASASTTLTEGRRSESGSYRISRCVQRLRACARGGTRCSSGRWSTSVRVDSRFVRSACPVLTDATSRA